MNSGIFKQKIKIQKYAKGFDEIGNPQNEWVDYKSDYAYVNGLSGKEYWEAKAVQSESTVVFSMRFKPFYNGMNTQDYRLVFNSQIYNITNIDNVKFENKIIKIKGIAKNGK